MELEDGVLIHRKTFIHRTTGEVDAGRVERLRLYSADQVRGLLAAAGLIEIMCREGWSNCQYKRAETMVATARARDGT
jgi:hypothetical protein